MSVLKKTRIGPIFVGSDYRPVIDVQSKVFIIVQALLGVNRLSLFPELRTIYVYISFAYALLALALTIYTNSIRKATVESALIVLQYTFNVIFAFVSCKRVQNFYSELAKFDQLVGCRPKNPLKIYSKVTANALTLIFTGVIFYLSHDLDVIVFSLPIALLGVHMVQFTEIYYHGHLFDLLLSRVLLINHYVESSLTFNYPTTEIMDDYVFLGQRREDNDVRMKHIMDLYQIVVSAHDLLVHAIKWQVLVIITFSFVTTLAFSYKVALIVIHGTRNILGAMVNVGMLAAFLATLVAPCCSSERVHHQALRLRELLATRLYDDKLDKWSRSVARALLALTESRDLSFSLMNMFNVDVSLPFTFTSLLVTYLIILLQFEKVINN